MNTANRMLSRLGQTIGALFICTIVVGVPLLSFAEAGRFFQGGPKRTVAAVAALNERPVDAVAAAPILFEEPLISVTFDDGYETNYSVAMPLLHQYGIRTTQYVLTGTSNDPSYMSWEQIGQFKASGHELACHTVSHADLTTLSQTALHNELGVCKRELTKRYGPVTNFASPYGVSNPATLKAIGTYFDSQRNTLGDPTNGVDDFDVNTARNFDRMNIIGVTIRSDTKMEDIRSLVAYTKKHNAWLVLTYHQANDPQSVYSLNEKQFNEQFAYLSGTDVRIVTVRDALQSLKQESVEY